MNTERLQHLITILRQVPAEDFDMAVWKCGTAACAVGWACLDPAFNEQGLSFAMPQELPTYASSRGGMCVHWDAVEVFFDLSELQARRLFSWDAYRIFNNHKPTPTRRHHPYRGAAPCLKTSSP